jgi:MOSC domain-containing protein YiiM
VTLAGAILSVQVGEAGTLPWRGKHVRTAIVKEPVRAPVAVTADGLAGDVQADRRVHGGLDKAVCVYCDEHVAGWERWLERELPYGAFGENLRVRGLLETDVHIGDVLRAGGATVQVSQPRAPCFKLAARWGSRRLPPRMASQAASGYYFRVLVPGEVAAGDRIELVERGSDVSVADVMHVTYVDRHDAAALERVLAVPELAEQWRAVLVTLAARQGLPLRDFGLG